MKKLITVLIVVSNLAFAQTTREELIPLDTAWKKSVHDFAKTKLQHSAWGFAHSQRDYLLAMEIAKQDNLKVDADVMFAAAFLHDMGGFPEFEKEGVDHAVRSAELVEGVLTPLGFPVAKIDAVKSAILAHTYYNPTAPVTSEEIVLRDADTLDFLGVIGLARIFSITEREKFAPDLNGGFAILESFAKTLPTRLFSQYGKKLGITRGKELSDALETLNTQSYRRKAL